MKNVQRYSWVNSVNALKTSDKILVVGAGAMGGGIAEVAAQAGHIVYLYDMQAPMLEKALKAIRKNQELLVSKGKSLPENARNVVERIRCIDQLESAFDASLAIEAIVENLEVKQSVFLKIEEILNPNAILATNTSSISITAIASKLTRPDQFVGMHFFNPATRMKLVEVIAGIGSSEKILSVVSATAKAWGKIPVYARSTPGFIVNRVARPYYAEGLRVLNEGALDIATIDAYMRDACSFPMGPFELMDLIGHDVNFAVTNSVFNAYYGDKRFAPSLIQQELVLGGRLGKKTNQGFYDYKEGALTLMPKKLDAKDGHMAVIVSKNNPMIGGILDRLSAAGIQVQYEDIPPNQIRIGDGTLVLTNGGTATLRSAEEKIKNLVHIDCAFDFALATRLLLARSDQCSQDYFDGVVGTLQKAGYQVSQIDDIAGMLACRTICMLANEAADCVLQGVASIQDVDTAMRYGTNYPKGPLRWADDLSMKYVSEVLSNLSEHYGEERYRVSPLIQRKAITGDLFYDAA